MNDMMISSSVDHFAGAGKMIPRPLRAGLNQVLLDILGRLVTQVDALIQDDHAIVGLDVSGGVATIQLAASSRLAAMADEQRGAYYMRGIGADGQHFRKGLLLGTPRGVRVVWIERGH